MRFTNAPSEGWEPLCARVLQNAFISRWSCKHILVIKTVWNSVAAASGTDEMNWNEIVGYIGR